MDPRLKWNMENFFEPVSLSYNAEPLTTVLCWLGWMASTLTYSNLSTKENLS